MAFRGFTLCLSFGRSPTRVQFEYTPDVAETVEAEEVLPSLSIGDLLQEVEDCDVLYANRTALGFGGSQRV